MSRKDEQISEAQEVAEQVVSQAIPRVVSQASGVSGVASPVVADVDARTESERPVSRGVKVESVDDAVGVVDKGVALSEVHFGGGSVQDATVGTVNMRRAE